MLAVDAQGPISALPGRAGRVPGPVLNPGTKLWQERVLVITVTLDALASGDPFCPLALPSSGTGCHQVLGQPTASWGGRTAGQTPVQFHPGMMVLVSQTVFYCY